MIPPIIQKFLPIFNFAVATTALGFQVMILYPWHTQLEKDFSGLQRQQDTKLLEYHNLKMENIRNIENYLSKLNLDQIEDEMSSKKQKL